MERKLSSWKQNKKSKERVGRSHGRFAGRSGAKKIRVAKGETLEQKKKNGVLSECARGRLIDRHKQRHRDTRTQT